MVQHRGGCHCRRVRWTVEAPSQVVAWECNCSICSKLRNTHFIVPMADFQLQDGSEEWLTVYTFGTHTAKHIFCKVCGVCSYYIPRSNPDGVAVSLYCVESGSITAADIRSYDGQNWEENYEKSGIAKQTQKACAGGGSQPES